MKFKKTTAAALLSVLTALATCGLGACSGGDGDERAQCTHSLTKVVRTDPSCAAEGNIAHYACSECGRYYFDEAGTIELGEQNIVIEKTAHTLEHSAATEKVEEHWRCIACGKYFTDGAASVETDFRTLFAELYDAKRLPDISGSGNIFDSSADFSPLYDDFSFRCFITWTNAEGKTVADFSTQDRVQINLNLNREGAGDRVDWYNFGVGYSKNVGLFYKPVESGSIITAPSRLTKLFLEQGGIYVVVVREGATVSAYFEDGDERLMFTGGNRFGAGEALVRFAANTAVRVDGYSASVTQSAICIGVADKNCVFDKAYDQ